MVSKTKLFGTINADALTQQSEKVVYRSGSFELRIREVGEFKIKMR